MTVLAAHSFVVPLTVDGIANTLWHVALHRAVGARIVAVEFLAKTLFVASIFRGCYRVAESDGPDFILRNHALYQAYLVYNRPR